MIKAKVTPNLLSFITVRRGDWVMKISVYKQIFVMLVAQHYYEQDQFFVRFFTHHEEAAKFIDSLIEKGSYES